MKKNIISLIFLAVALTFAGFSWAAETVYVKGTVTSFEAGSNITVQDEEGQSQSFKITEDTVAEEGIGSGATVEVEASEGKADYITLLLTEEEEATEEEPKE